MQSFPIIHLLYEVWKPVQHICEGLALEEIDLLVLQCCEKAFQGICVGAICQAKVLVSKIFAD